MKEDLLISQHSLLGRMMWSPCCGGMFLMKSSLDYALKKHLRWDYILLRKRVLEQWTKIPEKSRESFWKAINIIFFKYLWTAVLIAIPMSIITNFTLSECVIIWWSGLPVIEHYYAHFKEGWKDSLMPDEPLR